MGLKTPASQLTENPGFPGCCYPPVQKYYSWISPEDWPLVAAYHHTEIPDAIKAALNNFNASAGNRTRNRAGTANSDKLSIETTNRGGSIQQPVPIPHKGGGSFATGPYHPRSYSPSAIYSPQNRHSPSRSISSKDSNSSGSPPSATGSRRRDHDYEGSERSSNSPSSPVRSSSQDGHPGARPSSSLQNRRGESPIERVMRDKEGTGVAGKRRSNSDPKNQTPPSAYHAYGRDASPTQRLKPSPPASVISSSNHPYANPYSTASSSMSKLGSGKSNGSSSPPPSTVGAPAYRTPAAPPRARETSGPSITSVLASLSLNSAGLSYNTPNPSAAAAARARMQPPSEPFKRGVIPPHVRKAGSVVSGTSSSSSSTNSSAREGTVISDGAFTDYVREFISSPSHETDCTLAL